MQTSTLRDAQVPAVRSKHSVLIVDDDECVAEALTTLLDRHGYAAIRCGDAMEALALLRQGSLPSLIVFDLALPGMDGWELRVALKQEPTWADIPVVALSTDTSAKAAAIDAEAFLRKPVEESLLLQTLQQVLEKRAAPAASRQTFDQLANPLCFALDNLAFASSQCQRLERDVDGLPVQGYTLAKLIARAQQSAQCLLELLYRGTEFGPEGRGTPGAVDVAHVLGASLAMVQPALPPGTRIAQHLGPVPLASADAAKLGHVFVNLLRNAAQALAGRECPELDLAVWNHKGSYVVVTISDNGCGLAPELKERVFEPFFSTGPSERSSGLGLTVARRLLAQMGGVLEFETLRGLGTTVLISLPHALPAGLRASSTKAVVQKPRLLLVAESQDAASELAAVLGGEFEVRAAESASAALTELLGGAEFELILCSMEACELSAVALYAELARVRPGQSARIVLLHGQDFAPSGKHMLDAMGLWHVERGSSARALRAQLASLRCLWRALDLH